MSQSQIRGNDLGQVIEHFFLKFNFLIYKIKMAIGCVLGFAREASVGESFVRTVEMVVPGGTVSSLETFCGESGLGLN